MDGEVSHGGDGLWCVAGSEGGGIFFEQRIFGAVEFVFDAPVVSVILQKFGGGGLALAKAGDEVDFFGGGLFRGTVCAQT